MRKALNRLFAVAIVVLVVYLLVKRPHSPATFVHSYTHVPRRRK